MRLYYKEGPDASVNEAVVSEVNGLQVENFEVFPYGDDEGGAEGPALVSEDEAGNEVARLTDFSDPNKVTEFIWESF